MPFMKRRKLTLHDLSKAEMEQREQNLLHGGGGYCMCVGKLCPCIPWDDMELAINNCDSLNDADDDCGVTASV